MIDQRTKMGAVTLKVADLEKTVSFYQDVVGLSLLAQTADRATLGTASGPLVHLRHLRNGRSVSFATGLYHLALRVPTRQVLANWLSHYAALDAPYWQGSADHGVSEALYLSDPEGNGIEVYRDRLRVEWPVGRDGKLTMYTEALDLQRLIGEAENSPWTGISPATDMGHIHLKVADIAAAKRFYVDILEFDQIIELPQSALFVSAGGYHHHLGLNVWQSHQAPPLPEDAFGLAQYEILFATEYALETTVKRLKDARTAITQKGDDFIAMDLFGNSIALRVTGS